MVTKLTKLPSILILCIGFVSCAPDPPITPFSQVVGQPEKATAVIGDYREALLALKDLEPLIKAGDDHKLSQSLLEMSVSLAGAFPLAITIADEAHSFHDVLVKNARLIRDAFLPKSLAAYRKLLTALKRKQFRRDTDLLALETDLALKILANIEPVITTKIFESLENMSPDFSRAREAVTYEAFFEGTFFGPAGAAKTGAIGAFDGDKLVGLLEFVNHKPPGNVQISGRQGYVTSVGRLAKYARLGIGKALFDRFFAYAQKNKFTHSYLHVRKSNTPAISLYLSVGYIKLGEIPRFYRKPTDDALVMEKTFARN